jgi:hypothetical protein
MRHRRGWQQQEHPVHTGNPSKLLRHNQRMGRRSTAHTSLADAVEGQQEQECPAHLAAPASCYTTSAAPAHALPQKTNKHWLQPQVAAVCPSSLPEFPTNLNNPPARVHQLQTPGSILSDDLKTSPTAAEAAAAAAAAAASAHPQDTKHLHTAD